ncbi:MAG: thiamine pyrophosphate-dependent enzyme [Pseudomonadota bacterium]
MSDIARMTVAAMQAHGIERLFCLPGVQNDDFFDALYDAQGAIRPFVARHEQACSYMAVGAELATGKPQAYCVVPGQGVLNAAAGHSIAFATSSRIFALIGQIPTSTLGKGIGMLHEIGDQTACLRTISKRIEEIRGPDGAVEAAARTLTAATTGIPAPAVLEIPVTEWAKPVEWTDADLRAEAERLPLPEAALDAAAEALAKAERPMIFAGGGARNVQRVLTELAETLGAPVTGGWNGKGAVDARHPLWLELPPAHQLWPEVDVVLGVGTRMLPMREWGTDDALTSIVLSSNPNAAALAKASQHVEALAEDALPALLARVKALRSKPADWSGRIAAERETFLEQVEAVSPQMDHVRALRAALGEDGVLVEDLTQVGFAARYAYPAYRPRTFIGNGYSGALGWGYAASLGAKAALPGTPVVSIQGDGGFMYGSNEIATAVHHGINAVAVVYDDGAYGNVKRIQQQRFGHNRTIVSDLTNPDFVAYARSFGALGLEAEDGPGLQQALEEALAAETPAVIRVPVPTPMSSPWPFLFLRGGRGAAGPTRRETSL